MYWRSTPLGIRVPAKAPQDAPQWPHGYRGPEGAIADSPIWPPDEQLSREEMDDFMSENGIMGLLRAAVKGQKLTDYGKEVAGASLLVRLQEDAIAYSGVMCELARRGYIGCSNIENREEIMIPQKGIFRTREIPAVKVTTQPMWLVVLGNDLSDRTMSDFGIHTTSPSGVREERLIPRFSEPEIKRLVRQHGSGENARLYRHDRAIGITPSGVLMQVHRKREATVTSAGASSLNEGNRGEFTLGSGTDFANIDELFSPNSIRVRIAPRAVRLALCIRAARAIRQYTNEVPRRMNDQEFEKTIREIPW